jgi:hypothetical protein
MSIAGMACIEPSGFAAGGAVSMPRIEPGPIPGMAGIDCGATDAPVTPVGVLSGGLGVASARLAAGRFVAGFFTGAFFAGIGMLMPGVFMPSIE